MMNQNNSLDKKVSVIIATYRREDSLARAIKSVSDQTYKELEIIVVDDNDNDEWNGKVKKIVSGYESLVNLKLIVNHPNLGSAKARNKGIEAANGEYITFLDDDDVYLPPKIETQLNGMISENADYSITDLSLYYEDESFCECRNRPYLKTQEKQDLKLCHLKYHMTGTDTFMFRTEYLIQIGGFEPIDVGDEFYLMMKAIDNQGKFIYVPACDVKAYVHKGEGGLSSGNGKINGENALFQYKKKFFSVISSQNRRYITMRHHAVLAFAYKRNNKIVSFVAEGIKAFFTAPVECLMLIANLKN